MKHCPCAAPAPSSCLGGCRGGGVKAGTVFWLEMGLMLCFGHCAIDCTATRAGTCVPIHQPIGCITMSNKTINNLVTRIADADKAAEDRVELIKALAREGKWVDRETAKAVLMPLYAKARNVTLTVAATGGDAGKPAWPADAGTIKKAFNRLLGDLFAASTAKDEYEIPADVAKAAATLARLAAQYQDENGKPLTRRLATAALAAALAA